VPKFFIIIALLLVGCHEGEAQTHKTIIFLERPMITDTVEFGSDKEMILFCDTTSWKMIKTVEPNLYNSFYTHDMRTGEIEEIYWINKDGFTIKSTGPICALEVQYHPYERVEIK